jgi:hypothetical protein
MTNEQKQQQFLATKNMSAVPHPHNLPDLAPCFGEKKTQVWDHCFHNILEIQ